MPFAQLSVLPEIDPPVAALGAVRSGVGDVLVYRIMSSKYCGLVFVVVFLQALTNGLYVAPLVAAAVGVFATLVQVVLFEFAVVELLVVGAVLVVPVLYPKTIPPLLSSVAFTQPIVIT
jgi:hypothetical protein